MTKRRYKVNFSWPSESFLCYTSINNNHLEYLQVEGELIWFIFHVGKHKRKAVPYLVTSISPPVIELSTESSSHSVIRLEHGFFPIDWTFHRDQEQGPGRIGKGNYSFRFGIWVGKGSGTSNMNNRTKQAIKPTNKATSYRQDPLLALRLGSTSPSLLLRSLVVCWVWLY